MALGTGDCRRQLHSASQSPIAASLSSFPNLGSTLSQTSPKMEELKTRSAALISALMFALQIATNYCSMFVPVTPLFPSSLQSVADAHRIRIWPDIAVLGTVWGVIYALQLIYVCRLFLSTEHRRDANMVFAITCALNIACIFVYVRQHLITTLAVFAALWLLLAGFWVRVNILAPPAKSFWNRATLLAPFSLYLGWATFSLQLIISGVVEEYRGAPFTLTDIVLCSIAVVVVGWMALASTCDLVLIAGPVCGFLALVLRAHDAGDADLQFVASVAATSLISASVVRLATNWLRRERFVKLEGSFSAPFDPRIIEA